MPAQEITFEQPVTEQAPETAPEAAEVKETPAQADDGSEATAEAAPEQAKDEDSAQRDEKGRFRKSLQPRIDELTRARHEAEREAAYWKGVAEAGKGSSSAKADAAEKPTPDKFSDHNEYVEALAEWKADQRIEQALSRRDAEAKQAQQRVERETRASTWSERQAKFAETAPDFAEVLGAAETPIPSHVMEALLESEHGPALAYHLAKHPDAAQRIAGLSERAALVELGKLSASLESPKPPLKSVTKAPAPITPVKSGGGNVIDLSKASQAEYEAYRKQQGAWWAR